MIDNLALAISHGLMMIAALILLRRPDLDRELPLSAPAAPGSSAPNADPAIGTRIHDLA